MYIIREKAVSCGAGQFYYGLSFACIAYVLIINPIYAMLLFIVKSSLQCATEIIINLSTYRRQVKFDIQLTSSSSSSKREVTEVTSTVEEGPPPS